MEKRILIICVLLSSTQGRVFGLRPRIVNGINAKEGEIPFQVSLQQSNFHFCGGSILNKYYIVTAAHCLVGKNVSRINVIAGTISKYEPGQMRKATELIVHEKYDREDSYRNDIALVKIDARFEFNKLVQPVKLPIPHAKIYLNTSAIVSGWGRLDGDRNLFPRILQKALIWITDQEYCRNVMKKQNANVYPTNVCANDPSTRRGQCSADSGGPLIVEEKLIGIVSWSIKDPYCASTEYPGIYSRVSEYIDWITEHAS